MTGDNGAGPASLADKLFGDKAFFTVDAIETLAGLVVIVAWILGEISTNTTFGQAAITAALVMVFGDTGLKMIRKSRGA